MSRSETAPDPALARVSRELEEAVGRLLLPGAPERADPADVRRALSAAVRLYAAAAEAAGEDIDPLEEPASSTDAVVVACALLKARDLNPFDLALWFGRSRTAG